MILITNKLLVMERFIASIIVVACMVCYSILYKKYEEDKDAYYDDTPFY
tara:strand:- start:198 stop:344 length:147 start_codon:yes stop_codon:yes gene_type:complete